MARQVRPEWELLRSTLLRHQADLRLEEATARLARLVDAEQRVNLDGVIDYRRPSYREMALIQLAFAVRNPGLDTRVRPEGARGMDTKLSAQLHRMHIAATQGAYQILGKNSDALIRGNCAASDAFLVWGATATLDQLKACLDYACARMVASARAVLPMPELRVARLTFGAVMGVYTELFSMGSGGAYEQYAVASLLETLTEQDGPQGYHVKTKPLNASDRSSGTAGDVELAIGARTVEAYEVTANDWRTKLDGAGQKLKEHDLSRIHIIAPVGDEYGLVARELNEATEDLSVLDLGGFCAYAVSRLVKKHREVALHRLYECLDRYNESPDRVNAYVTVLQRRGLTVDTTE